MGDVGVFAGVGFAGMARSYSPGGRRRGMLAMVLPSGALPAPLVVEAACSGPSTLALASAGFAGMARSYSPGGRRRGMSAMVLPSGALPAPLVIAAGCS